MKKIIVLLVGLFCFLSVNAQFISYHREKAEMRNDSLIFTTEIHHEIDQGGTMKIGEYSRILLEKDITSFLWGKKETKMVYYNKKFNLRIFEVDKQLILITEITMSKDSPKRGHNVTHYLYKEWLEEEFGIRSYDIEFPYQNKKHEIFFFDDKKTFIGYYDLLKIKIKGPIPLGLLRIIK